MDFFEGIGAIVILLLICVLDGWAVVLGFFAICFLIGLIWGFLDGK